MDDIEDNSDWQWNTEFYKAGYPHICYSCSEKLKKGETILCMCYRPEKDNRIVL